MNRPQHEPIIFAVRLGKVLQCRGCNYTIKSEDWHLEGQSSIKTGSACWTDHGYGARGLGSICFGTCETGKAFASGATLDLLELGRRTAFVSRSGCYEAGFRRL